MNKTIVKIPGDRWTKFEVVSDDEVGVKEAQQIQADYGYIPAGYDFINYRSEFKDGKFFTCWVCYSSCE